VEVARKLVNGAEISARGAVSIISTLEFLEHQLSKMGHKDVPSRANDSHAAGADWPSFGGTHAAWRYSALNQINTSNVAKGALPVYASRTADWPSAKVSSS
jgi:glucose dehydrogenase